MTSNRAHVDDRPFAPGNHAGDDGAAHIQ
jgi:hypothetical protein